MSLTSNQRRERGDRVRAILQEGPLADALAELDGQIKDEIVTTEPSEADRREGLYAEYHALKRVIARLRAWEDDGAMAAVEEDNEQ